MRSIVLAGLLIPWWVSPSVAQDADAAVRAELEKLELPESVVRSSIGVTRAGTPVRCLLTEEDFDHGTEKTRVLLVGGLDGSPQSVAFTLQALRFLYGLHGQAYGKRFAFSAVPVASPDDWAVRRKRPDKSTRDLTRGYPPEGPFYGDRERPEAAYLWRWIGMHAPDLVVVVTAKHAPYVQLPEDADASLKALAEEFGVEAGTAAKDSLVNQLAVGKPAEVGGVPAIGISANDFVRPLLRALVRTRFSGPSPAREELQRRLAREPLEIATDLAKVYGQDLNSVAYIPALALVGRLRLGELTDDPSHLQDVERIVAPYAEGKKPTLGKRFGGSNLSGHLVFGELAKRAKKPVYVELVQVAADLGFDESGKPKPVMPAHNEMSDAVFMGGPILAQAGRLTGEGKYFDACLRHTQFLVELNVREDGLHRHSPLDEAAWGRGNGFPALGLAWILSELPEDHASRAFYLEQYRKHMAALKVHHDPTGAWHQVVDRPESYRELSCTCMITFAMLRGLRNGWLEEAEYRPVVERAWRAIRTRIAAGGRLVDVCTGTGKQRSLRDYYDRKAILGRDARGGAMALLVTTEMAAWERDRSGE